MARKSASAATSSGASTAVSTNSSAIGSTTKTATTTTTTTTTTSSNSVNTASNELPSHLQSLLASVVPEKHLSELLELRTTAKNPQNPKITHFSPTMVSILFDQPVRQYWFNPIPQIAHLSIRDLPSALPTTSSASASSTVAEKSSADSDKSAADPAATATKEERAWAAAVAKAIDAAAHNHHAAKIVHYAPPSSFTEYLGVVVFLGFTFCILAWIFGVRGALEKYVFKTDHRFNMAVMVHAVVLVKRSKDAKKVGELMKVHWAGSGMGRWAWMLSAWVEGWRTVGRVLREVEKVEGEKQRSR